MSSVRPDDYDALLIPGGLMNPDLLRQSEQVLDLVREFDASGKPIASICHGPWVLISAGLVEGRRLTSWPGIRHDLENAGAIWEDKAVVVDGNWLTSRSPKDLAQFDKALVAHFSPAMTAREHRSAVPGKLLAAGVAAALLGGYLSRKS